MNASRRYDPLDQDYPSTAIWLDGDIDDFLDRVGNQPRPKKAQPAANDLEVLVDVDKRHEILAPLKAEKNSPTHLHYLSSSLKSLEDLCPFGLDVFRDVEAAHWLGAGPTTYQVKSPHAAQHAHQTKGLWTLVGMHGHAFAGSRNAEHPSQLLSRTAWQHTAYTSPRIPAFARIIQDIAELSNGWDGEGSLSPTTEAKRSAAEVLSHVTSEIETAEIEVDPSTGELILTWYIQNNRSAVSVTIQPSGRAVVVKASSDQTSSSALQPNELNRIGRLLTDAGLYSADVA